MAATNGQYMSFLDPTQEDLLTAALNSNNPNHTGSSSSMGQQFGNNSSTMNQFSFDGLDPSLFMNQNNLAVNGFDQNFGSLEDSPYLDYADDDANFDYELNDAEGQMIGSLPDDDDDDQHDIHDKRKSPDDDKEDNENPGKRREGENKEPKKPGRKPLTSEPTNKRKAQNRAAQRAFRERKEKHLKDLETKVEELEKESEAANHENGLLRAQVSRLQIELREYRKRLSMNNGLLGRSPPLGNMNFMANSNNEAANNFQFEFPKFGSLPSSVFGNNAAKAGQTNGAKAQTTNGRSTSPRDQARANGSISSGVSPRHHDSMSSTAGTPDQLGTNGSSISSAFTPASLGGVGVSSALGFDNWVTTTTTTEPENTNVAQGPSSRIFQFNPSSSSSASPGSSSSVSQYGGGANSSCGTSPEPSHNSPKNSNLDTITECHTIQTAEGATAEAAKPDPTSNENFGAFSDLASQNGGGFDPLLFDTYREPQSAIVADGDFTGGFFNDALPPMDLTSPFDWADLTAPTGLTPAIQKSNPLEVADALQSGVDEDEVVPADSGPLLTCHKIWDKLQDRPDFKDGSLDIDGLCSELRAKARCSESGVVIDQKDVDSALKRLSPSSTPHA
jgi:AP-1-like factor